MPERIQVTSASLTPAPPRLQAKGMLGWLELVLNDAVVVDGASLRRARDGRLLVSYPAPLDPRGQVQRVLRPVDERARRDLEEQVLRLLRREERVP